MHNDDIDISETLLRKQSSGAFLRLLRCHSSLEAYRRTLPNPDDAKGHEDDFHIIWATGDYAHLGEGYGFADMIKADAVTGTDFIGPDDARVEKGKIIRPRVAKTAAEQTRRVKDKAEVFTPSWVCNAQNNLVDNAWFGRKGVFNAEYVDEQGVHRWTTNQTPVTFPEGKTWEDYVKDVRLEMCCGEAPYLASRYDTVTGKLIPVKERIGLLDRKLRVVSENVHETKPWLFWAKNALKATYGFEWQGDSLLIARETLLITVLDFYFDKFNKKLTAYKALESLAYIISWNLIQMDGLKMVIPETCHEVEVIEDMDQNLFKGNMNPKTTTKPCEGCKSGNRLLHNGTPAMVRKWRFKEKEEKYRKIMEFRSLLNPSTKKS